MVLLLLLLLLTGYRERSVMSRVKPVKSITSSKPTGLTIRQLLQQVQAHHQLVLVLVLMLGRQAPKPLHHQSKLEKYWP
jgi:hypothetical protein